MFQFLLPGFIQQCACGASRVVGVSDKYVWRTMAAVTASILKWNEKQELKELISWAGFIYLGLIWDVDGAAKYVKSNYK